MGQTDFVIGDISMDGFQVVRGLYFSRMLELAQGELRIRIQTKLDDHAFYCGDA